MTERQTHPAVLPLITQRWSPRAFDGSEIPMADLEAIFTAAGLAPSAYNVQPWTFVYARRGDENWDKLLGLLIEFNQSWAKDASALVFVVSDTLSAGPDGERKPNYSHSFDAGSAWAMMALQALHMGYYTHGMVGLDFDRAVQELGIPEDHRIEAAIAIGKMGDKSALPEFLQEREIVSDRKPVGEIMRAGKF
ncbi:MAG: nitroreductase family protein [Sphingomonadales bacterium]|nr:nitroreductase family protein [Sphingomonadales bacterium]MBD3774092.1 nitroreductase family protein [Paracoccaceae bacterium]